MLVFGLATLAAWVITILIAWNVRGREFGVFSGIILAIYALLTVPMWDIWGPLQPLWAYLHAAVFVHYIMLSWPRMRPLAYRLLVSGAAMSFMAASFLALPLTLLSWLELPWWSVLVPYGIALTGVYEVIAPRSDEVNLVLDGVEAGAAPVRHTSLAPAAGARPLRIVQITDPHLGPFMSEARLRRICRRAVALDPDLVLLTGDFLTMESHADPGVLRRALEPLSELSGRCFACFGNHDLEAPQIVIDACRDAGVVLLRDASAQVQIEAIGPVDILGLDYRFRDRAAHIASVCAAHPRPPGHLRLVMLHDPGGFKYVPDGHGDLVLSGHTHGGQLGLLRLGLKATIVSVLGKIPDHGLFAMGHNRLYVHRGTGHYGFPLRLGVPREEGILRVYPPPPVEQGA